MTVINLDGGGGSAGVAAGAGQIDFYAAAEPLESQRNSIVVKRRSSLENTYARKRLAAKGKDDTVSIVISRSANSTPRSEIAGQTD